MTKKTLPCLIISFLLISACKPDDPYQAKTQPPGSLMEIVEITLEPGMHMEPSWSPDGKEVAYAFVEHGRCGIRVHHMDGGKAETIVPPDQWACFPAWTPDGQYILYTLFSGEDRATIRKVSQFGGDSSHVQGTENLSVCARFSPDGKKLAFSYDDSGSYDLWLKDMTTNRLLCLAETEGDEWYPAWSPKGDDIAYMTDNGGQIDIWLISSITGKARPLLTSVHNEAFPDWSPDGRFIFFASDKTGAYRISRYDIEFCKTSEVTRQGNQMYPAVSPDGSLMACAAIGKSRQGKSRGKNWWQTVFPAYPAPVPPLLWDSLGESLTDDRSLNIQIIRTGKP